MMKLQKILCEENIVKTFREADDLIKAGKVQVNQIQTTNLSHLVCSGDTVQVRKLWRKDPVSFVVVED